MACFTVLLQHFPGGNEEKKKPVSVTSPHAVYQIQSREAATVLQCLIFFT